MNTMYSSRSFWIVAVVFWLALCIELVSATSPVDSIAADITLHTFVESGEVPLNKEVVYNVELKWQGELSRFKILKLDDPETVNMTIRGSGSSNKVIPQNSGQPRSIKRITYYLKPTEMGMAYVNGLMISYQEGENGKTESLIAGRIGVKITEPVDVPGTGNATAVVVGIVLLAGLIGISLFFVQRYQKRKREEAERDAVVEETVEQKYMRLLKETVHLQSDNLKESTGDLAHILNGYLAESFAVPAGNLPSADLLAMLENKELDETQRARLTSFFQKSDLIRFAGAGVTDADFHQLYDTVELFLQNQNTDVRDEEDK